MVPETLITHPIRKENNELLELYFMENPVCNPITETNSEVPSFEKNFQRILHIRYNIHMHKGVS